MYLSKIMNNLAIKQFFKKMKQSFVHGSLLDRMKFVPTKLKKDPGELYYLEADKFAKKKRLQNTAF